MSEVKTQQVEYPDAHHDMFSKTMVGFWVYIMSDCILFSVLFATYMVLHNNIFGGPSSQQLFDMPFALTETLILLVSSFTCGLASLSAYRNEKSRALFWFVVTFVCGAAFLALELHEFASLVREGNSWQRSAFLSSFFTLVGTHGCHITAGLLWLIVLFSQIAVRGFTSHTLRRMRCFGLFWHFLDLVWIFIFTLVYLMGVL